MSSPPTAISPGSWVLVTGATGFVASHVTRQLLQRGYKVRGTVRDESKAQWLIDDHFKSYADNGSYELVTVSDISAAGAFDEAVKGVSAVAHIASILGFDPNPNNVVPQTVAGVTSILRSASNESSVTRFVFTSSQAAATFLTPDQDGVIDRDSWNELAVKMAWSPPPYEASRAMLVYAASKVAAEQALWKYVADNKPRFVTNVVSPSGILGEPLHDRHATAYGNWIYAIFTEKVEMIDSFQSGRFHSSIQIRHSTMIANLNTKHFLSMSKTLPSSTSLPSWIPKSRKRVSSRGAIKLTTMTSCPFCGSCDQGGRLY